MTTNTDPAVLTILGILVTALIGLVGAIYATVLRWQTNAERKLRDTDKAIEKVNSDREALRVEMSNALEKAKDDAEETHERIFAELKWLIGQFNQINTQHLTWCQKHEDAIDFLKEEQKRVTVKVYNDAGELTSLKLKMEKTESKITDFKNRIEKLEA